MVMSSSMVHRVRMTLASAAICVIALQWAGCAQRGRELPGDTDSHRPWAAKSATVPSQPSPGVDDALYPIELLMDNQNAVRIDDAQRKAILQELDAAQTDFNPIDWELQGEKEKLTTLLKTSRVDETAALEQARRVTDVEARLKLAHLRLMIRVKNVLTPDQQAQLDGIRRARR